LNNEEVAAFDLVHDTRKDSVNGGVEGGVADEIMGDVDLKSFMRRDGRCEGVEESGECGKCTRAKLSSCNDVSTRANKER
jgi:hypothetical protein